MKQPEKNMRSSVRWGIMGVIALLCIATAFDAPHYVNKGIQHINTATGIGFPLIPAKPFQLGLDLQGGAELTYEANVANVQEQDKEKAVEGVRDVIERRVNAFGVGEPHITTAKVADSYRINVELPGVTDVNDAIRRIGETPILEFREVNTNEPRELTEEETQQLAERNVAAKKKAEEAKRTITDSASFEEAVRTFSDDQATKINNGYIGFLSADVLPADVYAWAEKAKEGDLSPVLETEQGYHIFKRGGSQAGEKEVEVSHILICYQGSVRCGVDTYSKETALAKATELYDQANAKNFAKLAKQFSTEPGASVSGGNLGYVRKGKLVPAFEQPVFDAQVNQIIGPVETEFGYHVIYKTNERDTLNYELSHLVVHKTLESDIIGVTEQFIPTALSGKQLERASVVTNPQTGEIQVSLQFDEEGKQLFSELTQKHLGQPIAIYLDGQPISVPTVQSVITDGQAVITGQFTLQEAQLLSQRLNTGALPVPVELIGQKTIGASLGSESLQKSLQAGGYALLFVIIFMIGYYRLPGLLSAFALAVYVAVTLAIFKLLGVTLTLSGIAGCILSIGMAVDANVLIFERLKEELQKGKRLSFAIEEGFVRAWPAIKDGNVSTIITCLLLMWFGSSFVQGFAFTLTVGILVSMFSAITVTRVMLRFVAPWFKDKANWLFLGAPKN